MPGKEKIKYYVAWTTLLILGVSGMVSYEKNATTNLFWLTIDAVAFGGFLALAYRANRTGDGKCFFSRLICLSWPIVVKYALLSVVIGFALHILASTFGDSFLEVVALIIGWGLFIGFGLRVVTYMKWIAQKERQESAHKASSVAK